MAFSATGIGSLLLARKWGLRRPLQPDLNRAFDCLSGVFIPQALASSLSILLVFRFLFGMVMGGTLPALRDPRQGAGQHPGRGARL